MRHYPFFFATLLVVLTGCVSGSIETEETEECVSDALFFNRTVNTMMDESCAGCHAATGVASGTGFILNASGGYADYLQRNRSVSQTWAKQKNQDFDNKSQLLLKATAGIEHGGGKVLEKGSDREKILTEFISRVDKPRVCKTKGPKVPFLEGVQFQTPYAQLRRATILLGGRLPTSKEIQAVDKDPQALDGIYDDLMKEDAFYDYLERGWNDILHTRNEGDSGVLDPETFPDRNWVGDLPEDTEEQRDYKNLMGRNTRLGFRQSPVKLITHLVKNEKPFTEVLTAPYVMVNPFSAKSYGIADQVDFKDDNDPDEFLPVTLPGGGRTGIPEEENYYHAGLLSSSMFWSRWESTATNLNRARTRVFYKIFLDTNILELAPRAADADKVVEYINPIVDFNQCNVCHIPMDPVAALLQNFDNQGHRRPFRGEWDKSYSAGFNGTLLPASRAADSERWLGEQAAADRRFPTAMVSNAYFILTGRDRVIAPTDSTKPDFNQLQHAFEQQQAEINRISERFVESDYNFKVVIKEWLNSPLFTAVNIEKLPEDDRATELEIVGMASLITPEDLARKIFAVFESDWKVSSRNAISEDLKYETNRGTFYFLFDGIDSVETTRRLKTPNGVSGAVMNVMANDLACRNVAKDFARPKGERILFPFVETDSFISDKETEIRQNIVHLYQRILGKRYKNNDPEIDELVDLWGKIQQDGLIGMAREGEGKYTNRLESPCRGGDDLSIDEFYTIRSWNAVVAYMLSDFSFFYE